MYTAKNFVKVNSADEACELLEKSPRNRIVAGNMWLRLGNSNYNTLIDISALELNYIVEEDNAIRIGACTTLRDVEKSQILSKNFNNMFQEVTKAIVGVQFRNTATIGGNVFLKHGFSDLVTLLLALESKLVFHKAGTINISDYLKQQIKGDLLKEIIIKKQQNVEFKSFKVTATDLSMVNVAVTKEVDKIRVAVGARPAVADVVEVPIDFTSDRILENFTFGSNIRGSANYRAIVVKSLLEQCLNCE